MAKKHRPSDEEKAVTENIQKRFQSMFTGKHQPLANVSIQEVEALKARIAELEAGHGTRQRLLSEHENVASTLESEFQLRSHVPATPQHPTKDESAVTAALEKRVGLWVTGISAAVGLAFFSLALHIALVIQGGVLDLPDKVLQPFTLLMFVVNLIGFYLIRRNLLAPGLWMSYLISVIGAPVMAVLVMEGIYPLMGGYLAVFALLYIALVLPKTSRLPAILVAVGAGLVIAGIEVWQPGFRDSTNHIEKATPLITGAAALGILALFVVARQLRNPQIQGRLTALIMLVIIPLLVGIGILVTSLAGTRIESSANAELQNSHRSLASTVSTWLELNTRALQQLALQPDILSMSVERQRPVLQAMAKAYPYMYLVSTTDLAGFNIARSDIGELTDYSDRDWFRGASAGLPLTYQTLIGRTTGQPALVVSTPIKTETGKIIGTGMFAADLTDLAEETRVSTIGTRGFTYVIDANNRALAHPDTTYTAELRDMSAYPPVVALRQGQTELITFTDDNGERWRAYATTLDNGWAIIAQRPEVEIIGPARQFQTLVIVLILAGGAVMVGLAWFTIRRTLQPITTLTNTISAISAGDLGRVVEVSSQDEIGHLAHTFNVMTGQIRNLVGSLEERVADRTHDLELAAEVGRTATQKVTDLSEMLQEAAEVIRARFDLYYTQIYLSDPAAQKLILRAGTGETGKELLERKHHLIINAGSLNGRAVIEKQTQIVADTIENPSFMPNRLLPNTRSEMCVPLIVGERVVGVLDMQSEKPGALSQHNLSAFEALAGQLAIAIQNAALFNEAQEARAEVEAQFLRLTEEGWHDFLNAIDRGEKIGYAFQQSEIVRLDENTFAAEGQDLSVPISITGTKIGEIHLPVPTDQPWTNAELELIRATSAQLAQHIENLRLLAQAERYRSEAEQALQRLTHEGWSAFLQSHKKLETGYVFDLTEVRPLSAKSNGDCDGAIKHPMAVGGQVLGELAVSLPEQPEEADEVIAAVAEQLSSHIENLRLSEINEQHAQRERTLRQITSALRSSNNPATIMRTAVRELGSILGRRTVVQLAKPQADAARSGSGTESESNAAAYQS